MAHANEEASVSASSYKMIRTEDGAGAPTVYEVTCGRCGQVFHASVPLHPGYQTARCTNSYCREINLLEYDKFVQG